MSVLSFFVFYDWLFLAITVVVLLYLRASRHRNYWKNQNVVHEKFSLFFGSQMKQLYKPLHVVDQELYRKHGRLFGSFEDGKPILYVAEPDLLKLILVKDGGLTERKIVKVDDPVMRNTMLNVPPEKWKKIRTATSPAFTSGKLRKMQAVIDSCAKFTSERLKKAASASEDVDMKGFYGHFTLDAVASCSFGVKLSPNSPEQGSFIRSARNVFFAEVTPSVVLSALIQRLGHTFRKRVFNEKAFDFYKNATINIIKKREESKIQHEDFLQMMLNAKEVAKHTLASEEKTMSNSDWEISAQKHQDVKNLTEDEALAQCVLFFLAGQDTASTTASYASYLLAINPHAQERLRAEIDDCVRKHGSSPSYDVISKLPYLDCVVNETLRVMSPGVRIDRVFHEDYMLGETGIKLSKDCIVIIPIYSLHHDPEFFPEPEVFNPDRFSEENIDSIRPYTFLPFGAGPRNCIGSRFALQLVKTCLFHAIHSVQFVKCPQTKSMVPVLVAAGDTLAEMADRVADYSRAHSLNAVTTPPPATAADPALASIENRLDALVRRLDDFVPAHRRPSSRSQTVDLRRLQTGTFTNPYHLRRLWPTLHPSPGYLWCAHERADMADIPWQCARNEDIPREGTTPTERPSEMRRLAERWQAALLIEVLEDKVVEFDDPILSNLMVNVPPQQWKKLRTATSPAFTSGKLRKMQAIIDSCAHFTSERLKKAATASEDVDMKGFYGHFTLDAVASCSFGVKLSPNSPEEGSFIRSAKNVFFAEVTPAVMLSTLVQKAGQAFRKRVFNEKAFTFYKNATIDIIKKREENNIRHEDFLQMMMNAKEVAEQTTISGEMVSEDPGIEDPQQKPQGIKSLSEDEALAQCVLFFLAGQDTASTTTSFASYLLAVNPQAQEKLQAEVDECFRKHGSSPSYDIVSKLPYLDCVVNETLRMMTPGTRFSEENINSIRPYTFLPFGAGPRNCIGSRFAHQLVKTCLLHAVHSVRFVKCPKTKVPLEYRPGFGLLHPKDLVIGVRERSS
ncbi:hypothetical protein HPB51_027795 [Rhipicephalus microplus]|uniref:Cytochrome n=1 Tax=Rhipicephalus microplus TaxID=6941 RepID=A0A9J6CZ45_RHIMP|nr:hypothetical protein HPB51_027795 [Rhipicephalus microplus]